MRPIANNPSGMPVHRATTLLFLLYLAILTVGLLVSNPFAIAGSRELWLRQVYSA